MRRVVHQHAYRSEGVLSVGEDFGDGVEIREVAAHPTRLPACASDIFAHAQGSCFAFEGKLDGIRFAGVRRWRVEVVDDDQRAVSGKHPGDDRAEAGVRAGDNRNAALKTRINHELALPPRCGIGRYPPLDRPGFELGEQFSIEWPGGCLHRVFQVASVARPH